MAKRLIFFVWLLALAVPAAAQVPDSTARGLGAPAPAPIPDSVATAPMLNGKYIPQNLADCYATLDLLLPQADRDSLRARPAEDIILLHHGLGMWLRNNWGLWVGSRLAQWFWAQEPSLHPDDISHIILLGYHAHLRQQPFDPAPEYARAREYWNQRQPGRRE